MGHGGLTLSMCLTAAVVMQIQGFVARLQKQNIQYYDCIPDLTNGGFLHVICIYIYIIGHRLFSFINILVHAIF